MTRDKSTIDGQNSRMTDRSGDIRGRARILAGMPRRSPVHAQRAQVLVYAIDRDRLIRGGSNGRSVESPGYLHRHVALQDRAGHRHGIPFVRGLGVKCDRQ